MPHCVAKQTAILLLNQQNCEETQGVLDPQESQWLEIPTAYRASLEFELRISRLAM
jgi:hypothetical protein